LNIWKRYWSLSLGVQILIFMAIGVIAGMAFGERAAVVQPLGDLFIRLLLMAALPLIFFNLLAGLTTLDDIKVLGRVGGKIFTYYLATTAFAILLAMTLMSVLNPGHGIRLTETVSGEPGQVPRLTDVILGLIPDNIFGAFASGDVTQVVVFAILFGAAVLSLREEPRRTLAQGFETLAQAFRKLVVIILYYGPIGIGALAAATVGQYGADIFGPLALFIGGVWMALFIMALTYLAVLFAFTRFPPIRFLRQTGPLYATTAATCSSLASLVVSLELAENPLRLPRSIYSFTLPLGAQLNKDGTAIMLASVVLFTAQAAGVQFDMSSLFMVLVVGLILSVGSGGIPAGGLVVALIFVEAFGLPLEIAAIVGGIYRLLDMGNTTINCMGDMVGTVIVAHSERFTTHHSTLNTQ